MSSNVSPVLTQEQPTHQSDTFVTIQKPTFDTPKAIVYIRLHSWHYTFYWLGQMYNDICPQLSYLTE
jgi:hypothetical protein